MPKNDELIHKYWMQHALVLAKQAEKKGEVPVGAVLIKNNQIIGRGYNQVISQNDPTAHAEIVALRDAGNTTENYRQPETILYVTLEPCTMCAGALIHARVKQVYFGAYDHKTGVACSQGKIFTEPHHNHLVNTTGGILQSECSEYLKNFFRKKRLAHKTSKQNTLINNQIANETNH